MSHATQIQYENKHFMLQVLAERMLVTPEFKSVSASEIMGLSMSGPTPLTRASVGTNFVFCLELYSPLVRIL